MSRLTRGGTAEPVSRDQILRHARGQGNIHFPSSADHEQDWQLYPVDPYSPICDDHTYICKDDRAGLRGYVQFNKYIHTHNTYIHTYRSTPVAQLAPRNLLTRWDVSSIPANGIFLTKN